jgi:DNA modification methylase
LLQTPDDLAKNIVQHFLPQITGRVLEPCDGGGAFNRAFAYHGIKDVTALEITRGSDFFVFHERVSWLVTNPPWSLARRFLQHAYEVSDNVVFLIPLCHVLSLRARIADMEEAGFGIKEVLLCPTPARPWVQGGFQLGAVHLQRGYRGQIAWGWLDDQEAGTERQESTALAPRPTTHVLRASAFAIPLVDKVIQCCITSPPYFGLRRYANGTEHDLGRERTTGEYVEHLVLAMREVRRVLKDDGVCFLNIGDSYHGSGRGAGKNGTHDMKKNPLCAATPLRGQGRAKSLCLIPQRVEMALADDGWIVRSVVIWEKSNAVPSSVRDRPTSSYEHVVILTKRSNYFWNRDEAREASVTFPHAVGTGPKGDALIADGTHGERTKLSPPIGNVKHQAVGNPTLVGHRVPFKPTRNMRDVWTIATTPHKEKHIAMFPEALVERCIRLSSRPGDVVMDCFAGSGTTGVVARQLRRNAVLMDISDEYVRMMKGRLSQQPEAFESLPVAENKARASSGDPMLDFEPSSPPARQQIVVVNHEFVSWAGTYSGPKFHALLADIPYGLHFMNAKWDDPKHMTKSQVVRYLPSGQRMTTVEENIEFQSAVRKWGEAMQPLLYPGALVMMFAGPRMWEWVSTGMQLAGFKHWDTLMWIHSQGFPKAMDIGGQVAKLMGEESIAEVPNPAFRFMKNSGQTSTGWKGVIPETKQIYANPWQGYKTPALKPAWEPILCFRAPRGNLTYAKLALMFGTGSLNVDGGRIGAGAKKWDKPKGGIWHPSEPGKQRYIDSSLGRFPTNVILDEESAKLLDEQGGVRASRYFYCPKASRRERDAGCEDLPVINSGMSNGARTHGEGYDRGQDIGLNRVISRHNDHPCVKPIALTRYLAKLLLPPDSVSPTALDGSFRR